MDEILDGNMTDLKLDMPTDQVPQRAKRDERSLMQDNQEKDIDIGFLFASPIVLDYQLQGSHQELVEFPQISWKKELKLIKGEVRKRELAMKIES